MYVFIVVWMCDLRMYLCTYVYIYIYVCTYIDAEEYYLSSLRTYNRAIIRRKRHKWWSSSKQSPIFITTETTYRWQKFITHGGALFVHTAALLRSSL